MNVLDAAHAVAHDYEGGCESLAPRVSMSSALLRNKVNPNNTANHLTLKEAVRLSVVTGDARILEAFARELGMVCIKAPTADNCADADVIEMMAQAMKTLGDMGHEINKTFADGRVERAEVKRVRDRAWPHVQTIFALVSRIEGMAEPD
ncbi:Phage regulatory protein CII (CP76) [Paraburkholderia steynii]|uniref:Phage regulatory protein CII (CP76) n=1 Tax=Paraburkholderia steynii TaxID=1245441 RepID=A0A7Z7FJN1_9BURK|nr:phage regulatory CII family protein [Paraburkholderia steynii]SDI64823.1 Phage regulatory protein CII (CP76) [Paraburkholderia steynii]